MLPQNPPQNLLKLFYQPSLEKLSKSLGKKYPDLKKQVDDILKEKNFTVEIFQANPQRFVTPLLLALKTKKASIMDPALDCLEKLMAYKILVADAFPVVQLPEKEGEAETPKTLMDDVIDGICLSFEANQEPNTQIQIIKALLSAVTTANVQGKSLATTVRTTFNIYLSTQETKVEEISKGSLSQMCDHVFQKIEKIPPPTPKKKNDDKSSEDSSESEENRTYLHNYVEQVFEHWANTKGISLEQPKKEDIETTTDASTRHRSNSASSTTSEADVSNSSNYFSTSLPSSINQAIRDGLNIFKTLCRLSGKELKPSPTISNEMRTRILALELINGILSNSGPNFQQNEYFVSEVKEVLCMSLISNIVSSNPAIFKLGLSVFSSVVKKFKYHLKDEISVFFNEAFLVILRSPDASFLQKQKTIIVLKTVFSVPQTLVDIFVNYDCSLGTQSIFESAVTELTNIIKQAHTEGIMTAIEQQKMKRAGLIAVVTILKSMVEWEKKQSKKSQEETELKAEQEKKEASEFEKYHTMKVSLIEGVTLFNRNPKKGIQFLINSGHIQNDHKSIAIFLKSYKGLAKQAIGEYIGTEVNKEVLTEFCALQNFDGTLFVPALRSFLNTFRLPGEGQQIDRIMQKFAQKFFNDNMHNAGQSKYFSNADACYVFAFSTIMLNTELHNPNFAFRNRMTLEQFFEQNRGCNDGEDYCEELLRETYDEIKLNEIMLKDEALEKKKNAKKKDDSNSNSVATQARTEKFTSQITEKSSKILQDTWKQTHLTPNSPNRQLSSSPNDGDSAGNLYGAGDQFISAQDIGVIRPMFNDIWGQMLASLSMMLQSTEDMELIRLCLDGLKYGVHIASFHDLQLPRKAFVEAIAKFTNLNNLASMKPKNIETIKLLIKLAEEEGNYLADSWSRILFCISQLDRLSLIRSGVGVVNIQKDATASPAGGNSADNLKRQVSNDVSSHKKSFDINNSLSLQGEIDELALDKIFARSSQLSDEAIVCFVKELCKVSADELNSKREPRRYSLEKLIEVVHYNLNRIKVVWNKLWRHVAEHFIEVGCHPNHNIAINAVVSLRTLAIKFIEQEELSDYHFQHAFLRPFLIIMQRSPEVTLRELVVQCAGQMILKSASTIRSGWNVILEIFSSAAADSSEEVIKAGFGFMKQILENPKFFDSLVVFQENKTTNLPSNLNETNVFQGMESTKEAAAGENKSVAVTKTKGEDNNGHPFLKFIHTMIDFAKNSMVEQISLDAINNLEVISDKLMSGEISCIELTKDPKTGMIEFTNTQIAEAQANLEQLKADQETSKQQTPTPADQTEQKTPESEEQETPKTEQEQAQAAENLEKAKDISTVSAVPHRDVTRLPFSSAWFPILKGITTILYNDARESVRNEATSLLFDTILDKKGQVFSYELWKVVFSGILFPIFDDLFQLPQQENDWVKRTCILCMNRLIDLFSTHFELLQVGLFSRVANVVASAIRQESQFLSNLGLDSIKTMIDRNGPQFIEESWQTTAQVYLCLAQRLNMTELLAEEKTKKAKVVPQFLKTRAITQLTLLQQVYEVIMSRFELLSNEVIVKMLQVLNTVYECSKMLNESPLLSDPKNESSWTIIPVAQLLKQEISAAAGYLNILFKMYAQPSKFEVAENLLFERSLEIMQRYSIKAKIPMTTETPDNAAPKSPQPAVAENEQEMKELVGVVVLILTSFSKFDAPKLKKILPKFYALFANLIQSPHSSVRSALKDVFLKLQPLVCQTEQ